MSLFSNIAISGVGIVFLGGILFPVFQRVCGNSPRTASLSNMKQLQLALTQYEQSYDETLPLATDASGKGWREAIYPFVKSTGAYYQPGDDETEHHDSPNDLPRSVAANHIGPDEKGNERGAFAVAGERSVTLEQFPSPSQIITLTSVHGVDGEYWNITDAAFLPQTGRELYAHKPDHAFYQHPQGVVLFAFLDGHVKAMSHGIDTLAPNLWTRDTTPFSGQDLQTAQAILKHAEQE